MPPLHTTIHKNDMQQTTITRSGSYTGNNTMRELIRDNSMLLMAISRFGIPFGFGDKTIAEITVENKVDTDTFLAVCNLISGRNYSRLPISLTCLMEYLRRAHSTFLDVTLPKIRYHLIEAVNYSGANDVTFLLMKFFDDYVEEVKRHMEHENNEVFTYIDQLLDGSISNDFDISHFSVNHSHMATKLNELKDIFISHYNNGENARLSTVLFDIIVCERDLMNHFHVENSLLVPEVEKLEHNLRSTLTENTYQSEEPDTDNNRDNHTQINTLGEREKDIVKCVARGMSNKEIADKLCLSVHTVATHRRNISSKLGIHSAAGLTIFAILHHLVDLKDINPHQ